MIVVAVLLAAVAAALSYRLLEEWTPRVAAAAACRAVGWAALAVLLVNATWPAAPRGERPLVLLDASLSMAAAGGQWREALRQARALGEVRMAGPTLGDTVPLGGRSRLAPSVLAARSSGRGVTLITDGEAEDAADLTDALLAGIAVRVLPRQPRPDLAIARVEGPDRLAAGDSLRFDVEIAANGGVGARAVGLEVREGDRIWYRARAGLDASGRARLTIGGALPAVPPGVHALTVRLTDAGDAEPRDDARLRLLTVVPTPGVVLLASPPDWESRFLLETLRDVAALPVRGFLEVEAGKWRRSGDLKVVASQEVAKAAEGADLLVTMGGSGALTRRSRAHGRWRWLAAGAPAGAQADWYLAPGGASPVAGAFVGLPVDSFPPGTALAPLVPGPRDWVGLTAQAGRRGAVHPALAGRDSAGIRIAVTGIEGLWRWAFRGGSSEQAYRGLVAAAAAWLLAGGDSGAARLRPRDAVVQQGRPLVFEWVAGARPPGVVAEFTAGGTVRRDSLAFDGAGRAEVLLPPGVWRYRIDGGGEGTVGVEEYSDEFPAAAPGLSSRDAGAAPGGTRTPVRGWLWLFGVAVAGFAGEWFVRRRLGLR